MLKCSLVGGSSTHSLLISLNRHGILVVLASLGCSHHLDSCILCGLYLCVLAISAVFVTSRHRLRCTEVCLLFSYPLAVSPSQLTCRTQPLVTVSRVSTRISMTTPPMLLLLFNSLFRAHVISSAPPSHLLSTLPVQLFLPLCCLLRRSYIQPAAAAKQYICRTSYVLHLAPWRMLYTSN